MAGDGPGRGGFGGPFGAVNALAPKLTGGMVGGEGLEPPTFSV